MDSCRLCGKKELSVLLELGKHPIAHRFLKDRSQEEYTHPVTLCFCEDCGFIQLDDPIPADLLYANYVCLSSWKYQPHIGRIVRLIKEFTKVNKDSNILEVGSNDGRFLKVLREEGYQKLIGIEPAHDAQLAAQNEGITTIPAYFNKKSAGDFVAKYGKCGLFISRQMLEHVNDLGEFLEAMRMVISPGSYVLFELPDFGLNLDMHDYSVWEEHINYFTLQTLSRFLSSAGIRIIHSEKVNFSGSALIVIGEYNGRPLTPIVAVADYINQAREQARQYADYWPGFRKRFIEYLIKYGKDGGKVAIYGAGSRACSLINFIGLAAYIEFIVDDQPEKQGKYMPGSKLPILPSEALNEQGIGLCLLAVNSECEDAVIAKHAEFIKRGGVFVSMLAPSKRLPAFW